MAVGIDAVYQKVLALANKEQRGYITPLEYNLMANQAQLDIFEQYFYDINQQKRMPGDVGSISYIPEHIRYKLLPFISTQSVNGGIDLPMGFFALGRVLVHQGFGDRVVEARKVDYNEASDLLASTFHRKGLQKTPIYTTSPFANSVGFSRIIVYDQRGQVSLTGGPNGVSVEAVSKPSKVEWGYDVIAEKALYNASRSTNFQLHQSEEGPLVIKILELAGITLNKPGIVQIADQEELKTIQQEKQ